MMLKFLKGLAVFGTAWALNQLDNRVTVLERKAHTTMATLTEVRADIAQSNADEVNKINGIIADVQQLKNRLSQGESIEAGDLDTILNDLHLNRDSKAKLLSQLSTITHIDQAAADSDAKAKADADAAAAANTSGVESAGNGVEGNPTGEAVAPGDQNTNADTTGNETEVKTDV